MTDHKALGVSWQLWSLLVAVKALLEACEGSEEHDELMAAERLVLRAIGEVEALQALIDRQTLRLAELQP